MTDLSDGDHFAGMPDDEFRLFSTAEDDLAEAEAEFEAAGGDLNQRRRDDLIKFLTMIMSNESTLALLAEEIYSMQDQGKDQPSQSSVVQIVDSFIDGHATS